MPPCASAHPLASGEHGVRAPAPSGSIEDRDERNKDAAPEGRVYTLDANGEPRPIRIQIGVTDGSFTEIVGGELREGVAVIVGTRRAPVPRRTSGERVRARDPARRACSRKARWR